MTPNQTKPVIENLKRKNILIVEDHPSLADILRRIITAYGACVSYVDSGNKALTQVKRKPPDLILLDLSLPDMDGLEVATRLRQNENTKSVPILLMSASPNKKRECLRSGCNDFILKPFDITELLARISRFMQ